MATAWQRKSYLNTNYRYVDLSSSLHIRSPLCSCLLTFPVDRSVAYFCLPSLVSVSLVALGLVGLGRSEEVGREGAPQREGEGGCLVEESWLTVWWRLASPCHTSADPRYRFSFVFLWLPPPLSSSSSSSLCGLYVSCRVLSII